MPWPRFTAHHYRSLVLWIGLACVINCGPLKGQSTWSSTFTGQSSQDQFGATIKTIGDLNADGIRDLLVGAPFDDTGGPGAGAVFVISGLDRSLVHTLTGSFSFVEFGRSLCELGDVDGDQVSDFAVGAPFDQWNGVAGGAVRIYSGSTGFVLFTFGATTPGDRLGAAIAAAGDVNGDGVSDLIIGAPGNDDLDEAAGAVYVRSGSDGSLLHTFYGAFTNDVFGTSVAGVGDLNQDGFPDILVGAPFQDDQGTDSGSAKVLSGLDGATLYLMTGSSAGAQFGSVVASLGDVNNDHVLDLAVGSPSPGDPSAQAIRVFCGATGILIHVITTPNPHAGLGTAFAPAGDYDGDNYDDILVGFPFYQEQGALVGKVEVISGRDGSILSADVGDTPGGLFGSAVAQAMDENGDGFGDFLVGIPGAGGAVVGAGSVRLYHAITRPVLHYDSRLSVTSLTLAWIPDLGDIQGLSGILTCSGATPGAFGIFGVSLAPADIDLSFGFPLLIANDATNLIGLGTFGFDLSGQLLVPEVSRANPFLAGSQLFIQFFESSPQFDSSNGVRMEISP